MPLFGIGWDARVESPSRARVQPAMERPFQPVGWQLVDGVVNSENAATWQGSRYTPLRNPCSLCFRTTGWSPARRIVSIGQDDTEKRCHFDADKSFCISIKFC
jgi:hypothetical protein